MKINATLGFLPSKNRRLPNFVQKLYFITKLGTKKSKIEFHFEHPVFLHQGPKYFYDKVNRQQADSCYHVILQTYFFLLRDFIFFVLVKNKDDNSKLFLI